MTIPLISTYKLVLNAASDEGYVATPLSPARTMLLNKVVKSQYRRWCRVDHKIERHRVIVHSDCNIVVAVAGRGSLGGEHQRALPTSLVIISLTNVLHDLIDMSSRSGI